MDTATNDDGLCVMMLETTERTADGVSGVEQRASSPSAPPYRDDEIYSRARTAAGCLARSRARRVLQATASEKGTLISCLRHAHRFAAARVSTRIRSSAAARSRFRRRRTCTASRARKGTVHIFKVLNTPTASSNSASLPDADARRRQGDVVLRGPRGWRAPPSTDAQSVSSRGRARSSNFPPPRTASPSPPPTPIHASSSARENTRLIFDLTAGGRMSFVERDEARLGEEAEPPPPSPNSLHPRVHPRLISRDRFIKRHHQSSSSSSSRNRPTETHPRVPAPPTPTTSPTGAPNTPPPLYPHHHDVDAPIPRHRTPSSPMRSTLTSRAPIPRASPAGRPRRPPPAPPRASSSPHHARGPSARARR